MKKKFKKIVIIGKSNKFILGIKQNFIYNELDIISWRKINFIKSKKKYDLIFLCGFNFNTYSSNLNLFYENNIYKPLYLVKKIAKKESVIVYINTKNDKKKYTFSRYRYAKEKLAYELNKKIKNLIIYRADLIKFNNNISINSNFFSKYVFIFFSKLNLIKTIEIHYVLKEIIMLLNNKNYSKQKNNIKSYLLNVPRTQFLDRALRFLIG